MNRKVKWGVLGVAGIAIHKVIPEMQRGEWSQIEAIASRSLPKAQQAAAELGIPKAYGSYEELLADPEIEAVYNPLPNHLHVPWTIKAIEAGKHVLCEKPLSLTEEEGRTLLEARDRTGMKIEEAFMVRTHPQWIGALELIELGRIGQVRSVVGCFSYLNTDPENIRNIAQYGGGALLDIGCYLVYTSRLIYGEEPRRVMAAMVADPVSKTDILTSGVLEYSSGHCLFTCGTQMTPWQRVQILGTRGRIEIEIPFNAPPDRACQVFLETPEGRLAEAGPELFKFGPAGQYAIQGDLFSQSIREGTPQTIPLESSLANMAAIDALFRSAKSGNWETPGGSR